MATTTVSGGIPGTPPVMFSSSDAAAAGQSVSNAISSMITNNGVGTDSVTAATQTSAAVDPTSVSAISITDSPTAVTSLLLGSNVVAAVDTSSTPLSIAGGAAGISVLAGSGGLTFTDITASGTATDSIVAGGGNNFISTANTGGMGFYNVATGSGDDTVGVFNGNGTVNAGTGHNTIVLGGGATGGSSFVFSEGFDSIVGSTVPAGQLGAGGTDTVDIGSGTATINPGSSNFVIFGNEFTPVVLLSGSGSDTVQVGAGGGTVTGGLAGNNYLIGGTTSVSGAVTNITGAANGDKLYATGAGNVLLTGGTGNETISAGGGGVSPVNGLGLAASTGNDTLVAGTGNDSIVGGTSSDTFRFINGQAGGSDTISNFSASDTVSLNGYNFSSAAAVLSNSVSVGGNTILTLTDGTTITFTGTTSVNANQIQFNK